MFSIISEQTGKYSRNPVWIWCY